MGAPPGMKQFRERVVVDLIVTGPRELTDHERDIMAKRVSDAAHIQALSGTEGFEADHQVDYKVMSVHHHHSTRRRSCSVCFQMGEDEMPSPAVED